METKETREVADRREFLKRAGKTALAAPAAALLLNAATGPAQAQVQYRD